MLSSTTAALPFHHMLRGELGGDEARVSDAGQPPYHRKPFKVAQADRQL